MYEARQNPHAQEPGGQTKQELEPCVKSSRFVYVFEELWVFVCIMDVDRLAFGKEL